MSTVDCRSCGFVVNAECEACPGCGADPNAEPQAIPASGLTVDGQPSEPASRPGTQGNLGPQALWTAIGGVVLQFLPILNWVGLGLLVWSLVVSIKSLRVEDRASQSRGQALAGLDISAFILLWWALASFGGLTASQ